MFRRRERRRSGVLYVIGLLIKIILLAFLVAGVVIGIFLYRKYGKRVLGMDADAKKIVAESSTATFKQSETSIIYDANGNIISRLKGEKDVYYINYNDIPKSAVEAIISIEDKKFFRHKGYDIFAILRAGIAYIKNRGVIRQGGSTITQQLARNIFLSFDETWERKAREIFIAIELEKKYSKNEIMEFYLNNIYFANGYYGIQSASFGYFGKGVSNLSLSQIAFLLSIPNSPNRYDPYENIDATLGRRNRILEQMRKDGKIDEATYKKAIAEKIKVKDRKVGKSSYVETFALDCAVKSLMKTNGFKFRYSFDDKETENAYNETYAKVYADNQRGLFSGGYRVYTSIDPKKQKLLQDNIDSHLKVSSEKTKDGIFKLQGSAVTIDNETGRIVAIVGGRTQNLLGRTFNRAYQSHRQPGSTIKPIAVYLPAFELGYTPYSIVRDERIKGGPANADGYFAGNMTVLNAVAYSKNTVAWRLFTEISPSRGIGKLLDMNFSAITRNDYYPAAALGGLSKGVSALELTSAYAAIQNKGNFREATCIVKITDSQGNDVVRNAFGKEALQKTVYDRKACDMMITCMKAVMDKGTGRVGKLSKMPCAGKTGTTDDAKDLWFAGFTKYYTTGIWVGYDIPKTLNFLPQSTAPLRIWKDYMEELHEGLKPVGFEPEKNVKSNVNNKRQQWTPNPNRQNKRNDKTEDKNTNPSEQKDQGPKIDDEDEEVIIDEGENPEEGENEQTNEGGGNTETEPPVDSKPDNGVIDGDGVVPDNNEGNTTEPTPEPEPAP